MEKTQEAPKDFLNSENFKIQLGYLTIRDTNTEIFVNSSLGVIGTSIDLDRDLGVNDNKSNVKLDTYYRFTDHSRIDFSWFQISRKGSNEIAKEIIIGDKTFAASTVVATEITTDYYKLGYGYSFYRSPKVELAFVAGFNILEYNFKLTSGGQRSTSGVTAPLPMFGLNMDYAITPKWLMHYRIETFYIEINNTIRGSFVNSDFGTEYRYFDNVAFGFSIINFSFNAKIVSSEYTGGINDRYRAFSIYTNYYF